MSSDDIDILGEINAEAVSRDDNSITFTNKDVTGTILDNTHELDFADHVDVKLGEEYRILVVSKGGS